MLTFMLTSARGLLVDASQVQAHSTASCGRCYTRSLMRLTHELRLSLAAQNVTAHSVRLARSAFLHKTEHKHGVSSKSDDERKTVASLSVDECTLL